jgi:hypothetical protein
MDDRIRRSTRLTTLIALVVVSVLAAGCGPTSSSATAGSGASAAPSAVASATVTPRPTPSATPVPSPTAAPSTAEACPIAPQTGRLPSDRMTNVVISTSATADLVTFVFGNFSLPEPPQGTSDGSLEAAVPPYTQAASGLPVQVDGEHVAQIRFSGMSLSNDVGQPTYDGPMDVRPDLTALRTVVNYDMSEGVVGWYIGYDGVGCVTLTSDATSVTVAIDHPAP